MNSLRCFITNSANGDRSQYLHPTYTKINSVYGFLCVDSVSNTVNFFYDYNGVVSRDELSNLKVTYEK